MHDDSWESYLDTSLCTIEELEISNDSIATVADVLPFLKMPRLSTLCVQSLVPVGHDLDHVYNTSILENITVTNCRCGLEDISHFINACRCLRSLEISWAVLDDAHYRSDWSTLDVALIKHHDYLQTLVLDYHWNGEKSSAPHQRVPKHTKTDGMTWLHSCTSLKTLTVPIGALDLVSEPMAAGGTATPVLSDHSRARTNAMRRNSDYIAAAQSGQDQSAERNVLQADRHVKLPKTLQHLTIMRDQLDVQHEVDSLLNILNDLPELKTFTIMNCTKNDRIVNGRVEGGMD